MVETEQTSRGSTQPVVGAPRRSWTWRGAFGANSPSVRAGGVIAIAVALAVTLDRSIPLATGLVLALLVPAALVDIVDRRLPNRLVATAAMVGVIVAVPECAAGGIDGGSRDIVVGVLVGALAMAGPLFVMHLVSPRSMGFGDVKAAAVAGAALGLVDPVIALTALAVGSGLAAVAGLVSRRRTVPFGPGIVVGAILALAPVVVAS